MMDGQEPKKRENPYKKQPKVEEETAGKTETFMTRNVKLITFLVCLAVFLVFLGPLSIWRISELINAKEQADKEAASLPTAALLIIADKGSDASWKDFRSFDKIEEISESDGFVIWRMELKDAPFTVVVGGLTKSQSPQYIRIYCMNPHCDIEEQMADLYKDDIADFIEQHQTTEK